MAHWSQQGNMVQTKITIFRNVQGRKVAAAGPDMLLAIKINCLDPGTSGLKKKTKNACNKMVKGVNKKLV